MIDKQLFKALCKGFATFLPGVRYFLGIRKKKSLHSNSKAEFCYTFWLSLLVFCKENNVQLDLTSVGELGSGGSFGLGICALLTGAKSYYALEADAEFDMARNLELLSEIESLFINQTDISREFPQINIKISDHAFPVFLSTDPEYYKHRVNSIKDSLRNGLISSKKIFVLKNWEAKSPLGLTFIFSRAVLEHVRDPEAIYRAMKRHLHEDGYMVHDIELHAHGTTRYHDGHYRIPGIIWFFIYGRRNYFLNRWNITLHLDAIKNNEFKVISMEKTNINDHVKEPDFVYGVAVLVKSNDHL